MFIDSINVEQFGTIDGPVDIELDRGLNVIHGPNEAGKSTLMKAIWFAMTQRATSTAQNIKDVVPKTGGTPRVQLEFSADGDQWALEKVFDGRSGKTHLRRRSAAGSSEDFQGSKANKRLYELLGFGAPSGRRKTPAHFGLWPLTWVKQGEDLSNPGTALQNEGRDSDLTETLGELTGQTLTGTKGQQILSEVQEEYEKFYTPKGDESRRSGAPLHEAKQKLEKAKQELEELENRQNSYEADLRDYARLQKQIRKLKSEIPTCNKRLSDAKEDKREVEKLESDRKVLEANLKSKEGELERWEQELEQRDEWRDAIEKLEAEVEEENGKIETLGEEIDEQANNRPELKSERDDAKEAYDEAKERRKALGSQLEVLRLQERYENLKSLSDKAQEHRDELTNVRGKLREIDITQGDVDRLREAKKALEEAERDLQAASARVEVTALEGLDVEIAGEKTSLQADQRHEATVDAPTTLRIEELVEVTVHPGKRDFASLRENREQAERDYEALCEQHDVKSHREAQRLLRRRKELENDEKRYSELLAQIAEDGIDSLNEKLQEVEGRLEGAREQVEEFAQELDVPEDESECQAELEEAKTDAGELEEELDAARKQLNQHDKDTTELERKRGLKEQALATAQDQLEDARQRLREAFEERGDDEEVQQSLTAAQESVDQYKEEIEELEDKLESADEVELRVQQAERALENVEEDLTKAKEDFAVCEDRLRDGDLHGLHERIAESERDVEEAKRNVARLRRRAEATKLLYDTLEETRREIRGKYHGPLRDSAKTLLETLFPGANVDFGEGFGIRQLNRPEKGGDDFDALSFGTREQVGIVVRLAMARLLASEGQRLPVFLDDILSSSDSDRFQAMTPVFARVAQNVQVIVTTCHGSRFRALGADRVIDLERQKRVVAHQ